MTMTDYEGDLLFETFVIPMPMKIQQSVNYNVYTLHKYESVCGL